MILTIIIIPCKFRQFWPRDKHWFSWFTLLFSNGCLVATENQPNCDEQHGHQLQEEKGRTHDEQLKLKSLNPHSCSYRTNEMFSTIFINILILSFTFIFFRTIIFATMMIRTAVAISKVMLCLIKAEDTFKIF